MEEDVGGGEVWSAAEIAEVEGVTRSFVNRLLRLTLLAPDIVEAILDGGQPKGLQLEELTDALPGEWDKQRALEQGRFSPRADLNGLALDGRFTSESVAAMGPHNWRATAT